MEKCARSWVAPILRPGASESKVYKCQEGYEIVLLLIFIFWGRVKVNDLQLLCRACFTSLSQTVFGTVIIAHMQRKLKNPKWMLGKFKISKIHSLCGESGDLIIPVLIPQCSCRWLLHRQLDAEPEPPSQVPDGGEGDLDIWFSHRSGYPQPSQSMLNISSNQQELFQGSIPELYDTCLLGSFLLLSEYKV